MDNSNICIFPLILLAAYSYKNYDKTGQEHNIGRFQCKFYTEQHMKLKILFRATPLPTILGKLKCIGYTCINRNIPELKFNSVFKKGNFDVHKSNRPTKTACRTLLHMSSVTCSL